jgi:SAM-dependent methyltransferase
MIDPRLRPRAVLRKVRNLLRPKSAPTGAAAVAGSFWDVASQKPQVYWTEHALVRQYVNECITGTGWIYPLVGFKAGWAYKPLKRALSIGCGTGALERAMKYLNVAEEIDAVDVSEGSIREAKRLARAEGLKGINYRVADADKLELKPWSYHAVFFYGSLHHISDPDTLLAKVSKALVKGGLVYLEDYVGPSRDEWREEHLVHARRVYDSIEDDSLKLTPLNYPLDYSDPSEMIASGRILPAFRENFHIIHDRPYWGNVLFPVLCAVDGDRIRSEGRNDLLAGWIEEEKRLVAAGEIRDPLFSVVVAMSKS